MSEISQMVASLAQMTQAQLLTAFVAFSAYGLAQGALVPERARRLLAMACAAAAAAFVLQSAHWPHAAMLCAIAVAGIGGFIALTWLTSRWLGLAQARPMVAWSVTGTEVAEAEASAAVAASVSTALPFQPSTHAA